MHRKAAEKPFTCERRHIIITRREQPQYGDAPLIIYIKMRCAKAAALGSLRSALPTCSPCVAFGSANIYQRSVAPPPPCCYGSLRRTCRFRQRRRPTLCRRRQPTAAAAAPTLPFPQGVGGALLCKMPLCAPFFPRCRLGAFLYLII